MRISNITAVQPETPNSPPDWRTTMGQIVVRIDTDDGLTGYGMGGGGAASIHLINTELAGVLKGRSAESIETHWEEMYHATLPYGRKGLAIMAISGVDLALWDIKAKAANVPVARLLGGDPSKPVPTYATLLGIDLEEALAAQHRGIKFHLKSFSDPHDLKAIAKTLSEMREKVGPDIHLMVDAFMSWTVEFTIELATRIKHLDISWIEEPLSPDDLSGYTQLRLRCPIPIAAGEHEFTSRSFDQLMDHKCHDILQPDICWCGGMTEMVKIYESSSKNGVNVCQHRGSEPWGLHAMIGLDQRLRMDPRELSPSDQSTLYAETGRHWMQWVDGQAQVIDGKVRLNERSGFGVEFEDALFEGS